MQALFALRVCMLACQRTKTVAREGAGRRMQVCASALREARVTTTAPPTEGCMLHVLWRSMVETPPPLPHGCLVEMISCWDQSIHASSLAEDSADCG